MVIVYDIFSQIQFDILVLIISKVQIIVRKKKKTDDLILWYMKRCIHIELIAKNIFKVWWSLDILNQICQSSLITVFLVDWCLSDLTAP